jgi:hypothetical protein
MLASLFRTTTPRVEPSDETQAPTDDDPLDKEPGDDDEVEQDIEEQLLKLNEQQRKDAKRSILS